MSRRRMTPEEAALAVVRHLRDNGHQALWAGGCVRDMLLNRKHDDIDVATDAPPDRIVQLFKKTRKVGMQFGVILVRQGSHWLETATFRADVNYQDGRRPERVEFTTAQEDAKRRDFTINGLFYDPIDERVIDYVGGQQDLAAGIIRAIGEPDQRFTEDHLRMLRAVRFAARFGFTLDPATAGAIRRQADKIARISPERIREELEKMFKNPARAASIRQAGELGLLPHLWPNACWPADRLNQVVTVLAALPPDAGFVLSLSALLHGHSPREAEQICRALRCSNQQIDAVTWLIENLNRPADAEKMSLAAFKKLIAHECFDSLLTLYKARCTAQHQPLDTYQAARHRQDLIPRDEVAPPPLVTGDDLIVKGLKPGPRFKQILDTLYDHQLNNQLATRDQALQQLQQLIASES